MKLYLLSCKNIEQHAEHILSVLPKQRRDAYARSHSDLSLGAGLLLYAVLGVHTDDDLYIGPYGKPFLSAKKPEFSISHSGKHVLLGVDDHPIGVDMERKNRRVPQAVQNRICLPSEKQLDPLLVFTRKECAMKLTGLGFSLPLQEIDTTTDYLWQNETCHFFTTEWEEYLISVLSAAEALPEIQSVTPEELICSF